MTSSQPAGPDMMTSSQHVYEVRPRKDDRFVDVISDALPFGACGTASCTESVPNIELKEIKNSLYDLR